MNQPNPQLSSYEFEDNSLEDNQLKENLTRSPSLALSSQQKQSLRAAIEDGLPLTPTPYRTLGNAIGLQESVVIETLQHWVDTGFIKRFGLVVRHRELGYKANAMVVWNIPDDEVDKVGDQFKQASQVTLCYRRPRRLPDWPYNLFCMIHGQDRSVVVTEVERLVEQYTLQDIPRALLFSKQRFKQRGAHFACPH